MQGKMTHELASTIKAWTTLRGREVVSLGRELLGGNGVVTDFLVRLRCSALICACLKCVAHSHTYRCTINCWY